MIINILVIHFFVKKISTQLSLQYNLQFGRLIFELKNSKNKREKGSFGREI